MAGEATGAGLAAVNAALLAAVSSNQPATVSLRTRSFLDEHAIGLLRKLRLGAAHFQYGLVFLFHTKLEALSAMDVTDPRVADQRVPSLGLPAAPGTVSFMSYKAFVDAVIAQREVMTGGLRLVVVAHECPLPTVDLELALCILSRMQQKPADVLVSVWRTEDQVAEYVGFDYSLVLASPALSPAGLAAERIDAVPEALRAAVLTILREGQLVVSFMDTGATSDLLGHPDLRGFSHHLVDGKTDVAGLVGRVTEDASTGHGSFLAIQPSAFGGCPCLLACTATVGLVIFSLWSEDAVSVYDPHAGMQVATEGPMSRKHLAVQDEWYDWAASEFGDVRCVAWAGCRGAELGQEPPRPEREAFQSKLMPFVAGLVALFPRTPFERLPVGHMTSPQCAGWVQRGFERLQFLGLVDSRDGGYEFTAMGRRLLLMRQELEDQDFESLCLMARADPASEPVTCRLLVRMALTCMPPVLVTAEGTNAEDADTDIWPELMTTSDFEFHAGGKVARLPGNGWELGVGPFRFMHHGTMWLRYCAWEKLRRASESFREYRLAKPDHGGVLPDFKLPTTETPKPALRWRVHLARDQWKLARICESALKLPVAAPADEDVCDLEAVERHLVWAYSARLFRIARWEYGFAAYSLQYGNRYPVRGPAVFMLERIWSVKNWGQSGCLLGIGAVQVDEGGRTVRVLTLIENKGHLVELWKSSQLSHLFLDGDQVVATDRG